MTTEPLRLMSYQGPSPAGDVEAAFAAVARGDGGLSGAFPARP